MGRNFIVMYKINTDGISWFAEITELTLRLLMSYIYIYIYIYMELLVKPEMLTSYIYIWTYVWQR